METYLVGGAVRDKLLGLPVKERDWVVVGSTPKEMIRLGYKPVGKEFPVFLHPETHEEYALARTERKIGKGYKGFEFHAAPEVTLEEDLKRRDLTINAMAEAANGKIIDPFGGQHDLKKHSLHHVSPAFAEDPVRILRIARFSARFGDFHIHPQTNKLMQDIVKNGEVDALVPERVWKELTKSLQENNPEHFFTTLHNCGALSILFPEISNQMPDILNNLKRATKLSSSSEVRFAALLHNINKEKIKRLCQHYRASKEFTELAKLVADYYGTYQLAKKLSAKEILSLLEHLDAFRRKERLEQFLLSCQAITNHGITLTQYWKEAYEAANSISTEPILAQGLQGTAVKTELAHQRLDAIQKKLAQYVR